MTNINYTIREYLWNKLGSIRCDHVTDNGRDFTGFRIENSKLNRYEAVCFKQSAIASQGEFLYTLVVTMDDDGNFLEAEREGKFACSLIESDIPFEVMSRFRRLMELKQEFDSLKDK